MASDLRRLFNDIIWFEIELWNAVDARLKSEFDLPLTHFEPMSVIDRLPGCRVYDIAAVPERTLRQFAATLTRLRTAGHRLGMEDIA